jgi:hypothetical protein
MVVTADEDVDWSGGGKAGWVVARLRVANRWKITGVDEARRRSVERGARPENTKEADGFPMDFSG